MNKLTGIALLATMLMMAGCAGTPTQPTPAPEAPRGHPHQVTLNHALLQEMLGEYDITMRVRFAPDLPWIEQHSVAKREPWYGKLFVREETVWDIPGMGKRHFTFYWGFSGVTGKMQKLAMAEMNTELTHLSGDWDPISRTATIDYTGDNHGLGKTVIKFGEPGSGHEVHTTYAYAEDGSEYEQWQFVYKPRTINQFDPEKAAAFATPKDAHRRLADMVGRWKASMKLHVTGMDEPIEMRGTSICTWGIEGKFINEVAVWGDLTKGGYEMHFTHGFHNGTGEYQTSFVSSTGTSIELLSGKPDPETGAITLTGNIWDPHMGEPVPSRSVLHPIDGRVRRGELWLRYAGKWSKAADITYTRE